MQRTAARLARGPAIRSSLPAKDNAFEKGGGEREGRMSAHTHAGEWFVFLFASSTAMPVISHPKTMHACYREKRPDSTARCPRAFLSSFRGAAPARLSAGFVITGGSMHHVPKPRLLLTVCPRHRWVQEHPKGRLSFCWLAQAQLLSKRLILFTSPPCLSPAQFGHGLSTSPFRAFSLPQPPNHHPPVLLVVPRPFCVCCLAPAGV